MTTGSLAKTCILSFSQTSNGLYCIAKYVHLVMNEIPLLDYENVVTKYGLLYFLL